VFADAMSWVGVCMPDVRGCCCKFKPQATALKSVAHVDEHESNQLDLDATVMKMQPWQLGITTRPWHGVPRRVGIITT
jgi:hypothetical protein